MEEMGQRQGYYYHVDSTQSTLKRQMVLLGHCTILQQQKGQYSLLLLQAKNNNTSQGSSNAFLPWFIGGSTGSVIRLYVIRGIKHKIKVAE